MKIILRKDLEIVVVVIAVKNISQIVLMSGIGFPVR